MAFKVRDLMIDVSPQLPQEMHAQQLFCATYTYGCPNLTHFCRYPSDFCPNYTFVGCQVRSYFPCGRTYLDPTIIYTPTPVLDDPIPFVQTPDAQAPIMNQPGMVVNPQNLAELKSQLRQSLAQVEAQEKVMKENMKPQTVEEVDMLEQKLTEALEELRQHKEELRRKSS